MILEGNLNELGDLTSLLKLPCVGADFVLSLLGEKIGTGVYRSAYEYNLDKKYVIKVEPLNTQCNHTEYLIWKEVYWMEGDMKWVKDWFAPVKWLSPNGRLLVMEKTNPYPRTKRDRPAEIPDFFTDVKWDNFGWIGDRFVCHDYAAYSTFLKFSPKMRKVGNIW